MEFWLRHPKGEFDSWVNSLQIFKVWGSKTCSYIISAYSELALSRRTWIGTRKIRINKKHRKNYHLNRSRKIYPVRLLLNPIMHKNKEKSLCFTMVSYPQSQLRRNFEVSSKELNELMMELRLYVQSNDASNLNLKFLITHESQ